MGEFLDEVTYHARLLFLKQKKTMKQKGNILLITPQIISTCKSESTILIIVKPRDIQVTRIQLTNFTQRHCLFKSISQTVNQSINQSINQSVTQSISHSVSQPTNF